MYESVSFKVAALAAGSGGLARLVARMEIIGEDGTRTLESGDCRAGRAWTLKPKSRCAAFVPQLPNYDTRLDRGLGGWASYHHCAHFLLHNTSPPSTLP